MHQSMPDVADVLWLVEGRSSMGGGAGGGGGGDSKAGVA